MEKAGTRFRPRCGSGQRGWSASELMKRNPNGRLFGPWR